MEPYGGADYKPIAVEAPAVNVELVQGRISHEISLFTTTYYLLQRRITSSTSGHTTDNKAPQHIYNSELSLLSTQQPRKSLSGLSGEREIQ